MLKRFLIAIPLAAAATGVLFLLMRELTDVSPERTGEPARHPVRLDRTLAAPKPAPEPRLEDYWPYGMPITRDAVPIFRPAPPYPACGRGDGNVDLEFVVEVDGLIREVTVNGATSPCFGSAARSAVRRWKYSPRLDHHYPMRSKQRVWIRFHEGETTGTVIPEGT